MNHHREPHILFRANHWLPDVESSPSLDVAEVQVSDFESVYIESRREAQLRNPTIVDRRFRFPMSPQETTDYLRKLHQDDRRRTVIEETVTGRRMVTAKRLEDAHGRSMSDLCDPATDVRHSSMWWAPPLFDPATDVRHGMWWAPPEPRRQWS